MKHVAIIAAIILFCTTIKAQLQSATTYPLPDSVKAVGLLARVQVPVLADKQRAMMDLQANEVSLGIMATAKKCEVHFSFPADAKVVATGQGVIGTQTARVWTFNRTEEKDYQLMIASAGDSAENFMLYSSYIYFPQTQKWKLIATCQLIGQWTTMKTLSSSVKVLPAATPLVTISDVWGQRSSGGWKSLVPTMAAPPVLPPFSNIDSVRQFSLDSARLEMDRASGKTDVQPLAEGVYYAMLQEGNGKQVSVTDTVSVFYKGYLYADGKVFDQTKGKPARFPLNRLIKGWQLGLPLCKVGGKIKLVILSGQAYSIRTRAAKIPPNSILVFEIEVLKSEE